MERKYNLEALLSTMKSDAKDLIYTKFELLKLEILEKTSVIGSFLIYALIIVNLVLFAFLFAFIAGGLLIGSWIQNIAGGFAIIASVYLLSLVILIICRKTILTKFQNLFLKELDPSLKDENPQTEKFTEKKEIYEFE